MKRLDLDDLPPKIAALLSTLEAGEELLLVQGGAVAGRLTAAPSLLAAPQPDPPPEQNLKEVFEDFRSAIEEEF